MTPQNQIVKATIPKEYEIGGIIEGHLYLWKVLTKDEQPDGTWLYTLEKWCD